MVSQRVQEAGAVAGSRSSPSIPAPTPHYHEGRQALVSHKLSDALILRGGLHVSSAPGLGWTGYQGASPACCVICTGPFLLCPQFPPSLR